MVEHRSSSMLTAPLRTAASAVRSVPGAGTVSRAGQDMLDKIGVVSPRGRRLAVYTGAGVLAVAGVVEWPVAVTGAAVAWLTQPRPQSHAETNGPGLPSSASGGSSAGALEAAGKQPPTEAGRSESPEQDGTYGPGRATALRPVNTVVPPGRTTL